MPRPVKQPTIHEDLTYKVIGIAFSIHKELGPIHKEIVYQEALKQEFRNNNLSFEREVRLPVLFKGKNIGVYVPDFIVDGKIILEVKAMDMLPFKASVQLSYYLKTTGYRLGLLLNFGSTRLQIKRRIYG